MEKAISVGTKASPGPLINHLRWHPEQYQELMKRKDEVETKVSSCTKTQLTMSSFTSSLSSSKESFKTHFIRWVVEQNMPLTVGDSPAFISMIKVANKGLTVPNYRTTYDLLYWKKLRLCAS